MLGNDVADDALLAIEVIAYLIGFIRCLALREDRLSLYRSQGIFATISKDSGAVDVHGNDIGRQFDLLIGHLSIAIEVGKAVLRENNGVGSLEINRGSNGFLTLRNTVGSQGVGRQPC